MRGRRAMSTVKRIVSMMGILGMGEYCSSTDTHIYTQVLRACPLSWSFSILGTMRLGQSGYWPRVSKGMKPGDLCSQ